MSDDYVERLETAYATRRAKAAGTQPDVVEVLSADLRAALDELERFRAERKGLLATLNGAYRERAQVLGLAAAKYPAVMTDAVDEPGWNMLFLTVGEHQATWHIAPSDMGLWAHVSYVPPDDPRVQWDGHTTEQKYARIVKWTETQPPTVPQQPGHDGGAT